MKKEKKDEVHSLLGWNTSLEDASVLLGVTGIIGGVTTIPAIICGFLALRKKNLDRKKRIKAISGLVISFLFLGLYTFLIVNNKLDEYRLEKARKIEEAKQEAKLAKIYAESNALVAKQKADKKVFIDNIEKHYNELLKYDAENNWAAAINKSVVFDKYGQGNYKKAFSIYVKHKQTDYLNQLKNPKLSTKIIIKIYYKLSLLAPENKTYKEKLKNQKQLFNNEDLRKQIYIELIRAERNSRRIAEFKYPIEARYLKAGHKINTITKPLALQKYPKYTGNYIVLPQGSSVEILERIESQGDWTSINVKFKIEVITPSGEKHTGYTTSSCSAMARYTDKLIKKNIQKYNECQSELTPQFEYIIKKKYGIENDNYFTELTTETMGKDFHWLKLDELNPKNHVFDLSLPNLSQKVKEEINRNAKEKLKQLLDEL